MASVAIGRDTVALAGSVVIGSEAQVIRDPNIPNLELQYTANGSQFGEAQNSVSGHVVIGEQARAGNVIRQINGGQIAIGKRANATSLRGIAIGEGAEAHVVDKNIDPNNPDQVGLMRDSLAVGTLSKSTGVGASAVGMESNASGFIASAIGGNANASGSQSSAVGSSANASGTWATALGVNSNAGAQNANALGNESVASAHSATAVGSKAKATEANATAVGDTALAGGVKSSALGANANASGSSATALGNAATASAQNATAIGVGAQATLDNSVALGSNSVTSSGLTPTSAGTTKYETASIGGITYGAAGGMSAFAGANPNSVVSLGTADSPRRLQNVAAGLISATSTDAVNGSQLYSVASAVAGRAVPFTTQVNGTLVETIGDSTKGTPDTTVNFVDGNATTARVDNKAAPNKGITFDVKVDDSTIKIVNGALTAVTSAGTPVDLPSSYTHVNDGTATQSVGSPTTNLGRYNEKGGAIGTKSIAVGVSAKSEGINSIAVGLGANTNANGENTISLGSSAVSADARAIAIGAFSQAVSSHTIAVGNNAIANASDALAMGRVSRASKEGAIALGAQTSASSNHAIALGSRANASATRAVSLGADASASVNRSVALGDSATTVAAVVTKEAEVNGVKYGNFAGAAPISVVSVGSEGNERQIHNVAAGRINATSTDAINGSQLYMVAQEVGNRMQSFTTSVNGTKAETISNKGDVNFVDGKATTARAIDGDITFDVNVDGSSIVNNNGKLSGATVVSGNNTTVTNTATSGAPVYKVDARDTLVTGDQGVTITGGTLNANGVRTYNVAANIDNSTITINKDGQLVANIPEVNITEGEVGALPSGALEETGDTTGFVNSTNLVNAINASGWNVTSAKADGGTVEGTTVSLVNPGETVTFIAGKNMSLTQDGQSFTYATKDDVEFTTITVDSGDTTSTTGPVIITGDGINMGGNPITDLKSNLPDTYNTNVYNIGGNDVTKSQSLPVTLNVHNAATVGDILNSGWNLQGNGDSVDFVKPYDTVNFIDGKATKATVEADANGEVSTVKYDVQYDGTSIKLNEAGQLTATAPTIGGITIGVDGSANELNGDTIGFVTNQTVINAINKSGWNVTSAKADGGTVEGTTVSLVNPGETVTFIAGKNMSLTQDGQSFTYATKDDVEFTTITVDSGDTTSTTGPVIITGDGINMGGNPITDLKSNLPDTYNNNVYNIGGNDVTKSQSLPVTLNVHNAATVGDILNSGWNLQGNGDSVDFVKPYDTVNFIDGKATKATVEADANGEVSTVKYDVQYDGTSIKLNEAGQLTATAPTIGGITIGVDGSANELNGDTIGFVTNQTVINAINKSGWNVTSTKADGGTVEGTTVSLVNPGETVTFIAGKNMSLTQDGQSFTYATKDDVEFTTITVDSGDTTSTTGPVIITGDGINMGGNPITDLKSNLPDTYNTNVYNIGGQPVTKSQELPLTLNVNNAATVGDILNSGWNLQGNGDSVDFVKPYDTVNFIDGKATKATVEADANGEVSTVKYDVQYDGTSIKLNEAGQLTATAPTIGGITIGVDGSANELNGDTIGFVTNQTVINAINKSGWNVTSAKADGGTVEGTTVSLVNPGETVTFIAGKNMSLTQDGQSFTYATKDDVEFTTITVDSGDTTSTTGPVIITGDGINMGGNPITDLKSNLPDTYNTNVYNIGGNDVTKSQSLPVTLNVHNAATVGDILNSGWNLQGNGDSVDFVKPYDTVNFIDGKATKATVEADANGEVSTVKYDVQYDGTSIKLNEAGQLTATAPTIGGITIGVDGSANELNGDTIGFVTNQTVINAINKSGWNVTSTKADGGTVEGTTVSLVNPGETVTFIAGKNMSLTQDGQSFTYATKDDVEFTTITVDSGDTTSTTGPVIITGDGINMGGNPITDLKSNLPDTYNNNVYNIGGNDVTKSQSLPVTLNVHNAATVGDILNSGWNLQGNGDSVDFVKPYDTVNFIDGKATKATVEADANGEVSTVKYDVQYDGTSIKLNEAGQLTATAPTIGGITIGVDGSANELNGDTIGFVTNQTVINAINKSGWNVTSTKADGGTVEGTTVSLVNPGETVTFIAGKNMSLTQDGQSFTYATKDDVEFTTITVDSGDTTSTTGPVIITGDGINMGGNPITDLKSNLPDTYNTNVYNIGGQPVTKSQELPLTLNVHNAATVGDILNSGWNLQGNGDSVDFVKPYDTVNFVNGNATTAKVEADANGEVSTVKYDVNVDGTSIVINKDGQLTAVAPANTTVVKAGTNVKDVTKDASGAWVVNAEGTNVYAGSKNVVVKATETSTNDVNYTVDIARDLNVDSVTTGNTKIDNNGLTINGGPSVTVDGIDAGGKKITNVAAGSDDTDAVNFGQLKDYVSNNAPKTTVSSKDGSVTVAQDGNNYDLSVKVDGTTISKGTDGALQINTTTVSADPATGKLVDKDPADAGKPVTAQSVVDAVNSSGFNLTTSGNTTTPNAKQMINPGATVDMAAGKNLTVAQENGKVTYALSDKISVETVQVGGDTGPTIGATDPDENGVRHIVINPNGGEPARITNVAPGINGTDAVNVNQLNQGLGNLRNDINNVGKKAYAGVAGAIAQSSIPQVTRPGATGLGVGGGYYGGESAMAIGVSSMSDGGNWIIKGNFSTNTNGDVGVGAGALYQW
ncbi:surface fibril protein [Bergeriella denitrificans]|uniref:Surface fibril protein n=4 Tax=Bergeriella denitrificans TaxID=494 RepID=A0A378UJ49_BERDE|nr:surface fibril protein [Bergeriella denitrificans]